MNYIIIIIIIIMNIAVGISIGISGVAGFLLPMFYTGVLFMDVPESMTLSFSAFAASGIIGAFSYSKTKEIDFKFCIKLAIGATIGSLIGVWFNNIVPVIVAKRILYSMVLVSGGSLLLTKKEGVKNPLGEKIKKNTVAVIILGILVSAISSFTGAGGPILTVPILTLIGFSIRQAVGMSLFNSIFIALPAISGYYMNTTSLDITLLLLIAVLSHSVGIIFGVKISNKINQNILKKSIAVISIAVSIYMIYSTF